MKFWTFLIVSFFLVGFGQPAWVPEAGLLAAVFGYALFWKAMLEWESSTARFFLAAGWFVAVHAVQLSWMTETHYMGPLILGVYAFLLLGLGTQFAFFSSLLKPKTAPTPFCCLALAGGFVLLEWIRVYFLTGFTWNPAGLALVANRYSIQLASLFGIYGLTFWVLWTNLGALAFFLRPTARKGAIWLILALFPYGFGMAHEAWVRGHFKAEKQFAAALVDTALLVEEKNRDRRSPLSFVPPLVQWERSWEYLNQGQLLDFIVFPEAAFPYGTDVPFCPLEVCAARWKFHFGEAAEIAFPPLQAPYAFLYEWKGKSNWMVTNAFFAQTLANYFHADVIIGFDYEGGDELRTNAAFLFRSGSLNPERYDKRILAPVGEYIPLQKVKWVAEFLSREFGIEDSFHAGTEAKIFQARLPIGVPICLEEIYSGLVRDLRNRGAELLVSLSNDVWFPSTRLARQHFDHGRVRAVENGVFLLRSSNMGVTGVVDCFGQPVATQTSGNPGALHISIPIFSYPTLFSFWGNGAILSASGLSFALFLLMARRRKSCL